jgi:serine/threonine protein kinase
LLCSFYFLLYQPDNIGFAGNAVKLFDFGLAKRLADLEPSETVDIDLNAPDDSPAAVLPPSGSNDNGPIYALTGNTGSLRYMAPEVARDECYGLSVDVYS